MNWSLWSFFRLGIALLMSAAFPATHAWTIVDLGTLGDPTGNTPGYATAIRVNNSGVVVGQAQTASFAHNAFIWRQSTGMQDLGTLGADWGIAIGVDPNAYVAGTSGTALVYPSGTYRAFISGANGGTINSLGLINGKATQARGISPDGDRRVIGNTVQANGSSVDGNGFISAPNGGALSLLPKPAGADRCIPYGIGVGGRIVGACDESALARAYISYNFGTGTTGFLATPAGAKSRALAVNATYAVGGITPASGSELPVRWSQTPFLPAYSYLVMPQGATRGNALGINASNQIVGRISGSSGFYADGRAVLWIANNSPTILDQLPEVQAAGWTRLQTAHAINDSGWIVGTGTNGVGAERAFLLKP